MWGRLWLAVAGCALLWPLLAGVAAAQDEEDEDEPVKKHHRESLLNETGDLESGFSFGIPIIDGQRGLEFGLGGFFTYWDPLGLSLYWSLFQDAEGRVLPGNLMLGDGVIFHTDADKGPPYAGIGLGCNLGLGMWPVEAEVRAETVPVALVAERRWIFSLPESVVLNPYLLGYLSLGWLVLSARVGSDLAFPVYHRDSREIQAAVHYSFSFGGAFGDPKVFVNSFWLGGQGLVSFGEEGEHGFSLTMGSTFWWWKPWLEFFVSGSVPLVGTTHELEGVVHFGVDIGFEELLGKDPNHLPHR